jgi:murein DD-endopeptidase MepM/ murein hydrolase activator NlpD
MTAKDYKVSFPYGATSAPYSKDHPHRGNDRACPTGTPVVINGVTLGLTGATGMVSGPHLHTQEWRGDVATTRKPENEFKAGTVVDTGTRPQWGKFVTVQVNGWNTTYCHLSEIKVRAGQIIGEQQEMVTKHGLDVIYRFRLGIAPTQHALDNFLGKVTFDVADDAVVNSEAFKKKVEQTKLTKQIDTNQLPSAIQAALKN